MVERKTGGKKRGRERDKKRGKEKARRGREGNNEPIQRPNPRSYTFFLSSPSPRFGPRTFFPSFFFSFFFPEQTSSGIYTRATRGGKLARGQDSTCLHAPVLHRSSTNDRLLIITTNEGIRLKLHSIASKNRIFCVTFFLVSCFIQDAIFITRSRLLLKG